MTSGTVSIVTMASSRRAHSRLRAPWPRILRTTAKRLIAGKIVVTVRGAEHVIHEEEAEELRDAIGLALVGPGQQVACEVVERR